MRTKKLFGALLVAVALVAVACSVPGDIKLGSKEVASSARDVEQLVIELLDDPELRENENERESLKIVIRSHVELAESLSAAAGNEDDLDDAASDNTPATEE